MLLIRNTFGMPIAPASRRDDLREAAGDEIDDYSPPGPSRPQRRCNTPDCARHARPRGRFCGACAVRRWRESHPDRAASHERNRVWTEAQKLLRNARAYVAVLVSRGKLAPAACEQRGCTESRFGHTVPTWDDPARPRAVRWFCGQHRRESALMRAESKRLRAEYRATITELVAAIDLLPLDLRQRLDAAGRDGVNGRGAERGSAWYWWAVRRAYETWRVNDEALAV